MDETTGIDGLRTRLEKKFPAVAEARLARTERERVQREIIAALITLRGKRNQSEVAKAMGTTQSAVSRIESAAGDIGISTLLRYGEAIGLTPADLFSKISEELSGKKRQLSDQQR
ncbi:MAG: helix-turn-helix transcriptional regulator [Mesorhizobium sp.]|nr:helix-turn-helix transcriptional regulator [Mesorhizobium sp.]